MDEESHIQIQTRVGIRACKFNISNLKKQLDQNSENRLANDKQNRRLAKKVERLLDLTDDEGSEEEKDSEEEKSDSEGEDSEAEDSEE